MKSVAIAALAALAALTNAAPAPKKTYYLKTESIDGKRFDGLYVSGYHTSAGTNAAVVSTKNQARPAYVTDDKSLFFSFGKGADSQYPAQLAITDPSAAWGTMTINIVDKPSRSFAMKDGHVIVAGYPERDFDEMDMGAHWRVCEWTHGSRYPELFWNFPQTWDNIQPKFVPSNCERVNLKAVEA